MEDFFSGVWELLSKYGLFVVMVVATFSVALMRTAKATGKADWLEAGMCSFFALGIWLVLGYFGLPEEACVGIGAFIAYMGTHRVSSWVEDKLGFDKKDEEE